MTAAAEQALIAKWRKGQNVGPEDHVTTIDDLDELEGFRSQLAASNRLTTDLMQAIQRRKAQIERQHR
jgi:hypothetical protein